jgi:hypothetical protein
MLTTTGWNIHHLLWLVMAMGFGLVYALICGIHILGLSANGGPREYGQHTIKTHHSGAIYNVISSLQWTQLVEGAFGDVSLETAQPL